MNRRGVYSSLASDIPLLPWPPDPEPERRRRPSLRRRIAQWLQSKPVLRAYPVQSTLTLFCSNFGARRIARYIYRDLVRLDPVVQTLLTPELLEYVLILHHVNRINQCGLAMGYFECDSEAKQLHKLVSPIWLPYLAFKYISSLGRSQEGNPSALMSVVPWAAQPEEFFAAPRQIHPSDVLVAAGRSPGNGRYSVDEEWLAAYCAAIPRLMQSTFLYANLLPIERGYANMHVTSRLEIEGLVSVHACFPYEEEVMIQGAMYQWRHETDRAQWPGDTQRVTQELYHLEMINLRVAFHNRRHE